MNKQQGEVAEWSKAAVLKTVVSKGPWVRILPSPMFVPGDVPEWPKGAVC
jgi:hypothetical protein